VQALVERRMEEDMTQDFKKKWQPINDMDRIPPISEKRKRRNRDKEIRAMTGYSRIGRNNI
jgi:hypothetical protein